MKAAGLAVYPVDHLANRFTPKVPTFTIDLSDPGEVKVAEQLLRFTEPKAVHFGLMCGTCSRAREKSLALPLRQQGAPEPVPLRDAQHLMGRPHLKPHDKLKVQKANQIYRHAISLLMICFELGCIVSIENPARSWLWPLLAMLVKETQHTEFIRWYFSMQSTMFDSCMHGSSRAKSTTILGTEGVFESLGVRCDNSHPHQGWSATKTVHQGWIFDTAGEAEYPPLLSQRIAACIARQVPSECLHIQRTTMRLTSLKVQGRQHKTMTQLIPDFGSFFWAPLQYNPAKNEKCLPPKTAGEENEVEEHMAENTEDNAASEKNVKVGVFLEPEEHLRLAANLTHPMDTNAIIPDHLRKAVFKLLTMEPAERAKHRLGMLKLYRDRAEELQKAEVELHASLPTHVQGVVKGKRILLFEERLRATNFPDLQVVTDFKQGVNLVGEEPPSPLFWERLQPATMTVEQLEGTAKLNRRLTMSRPLAEHEVPHADRLVELSQEEVDEHFLAGPFFSEDEVTAHLGSPDWTLTKRFLLLQGEDMKERVIDDYKRSHVNAAFSSRSYLELQDADVLAALITMVMQLIARGPSVQVLLQDGTMLEGILSKSVQHGVDVVGRCFDLSKAYKQIAVQEQSLKHAVLGARSASGKWHLYTSQSLPFGAVASVYAFNKSARALQHLLLEDFSIVTTNYFDDFPTIDLATGGDVTTGVVSQFFQLLGWRHAVSGKKAKPFESSFAALGVEYNLVQLTSGKFTVGNKPERLNRIQRLISQVAEDGKISPSLAASIHGLLNFASGFTLGKSLQMSAHGFSLLASGASMSPEALRQLCDHSTIILETLRPRCIELPVQNSPALIYTDGAYDADNATWGAIVVDQVTSTRLCFAGTVPDFLLAAWKHLVGDQLICQIEMFAVLCVRWKLRNLLANRRTILFIDNEPCRFALIKGRSSSDPLFRMSHACACVDAAMPCFIWYERVPSYSNPADLPSRRRELEACHRWSLSFAGDIALPPELLASIVDGVPFPELLSDNGDWIWVISQRGKAKDDNKDS